MVFLPVVRITELVRKREQLTVQLRICRRRECVYAQVMERKTLAAYLIESINMLDSHAGHKTGNVKRLVFGKMYRIHLVLCVNARFGEDTVEA